MAKRKDGKDFDVKVLNMVDNDGAVIPGTYMGYIAGPGKLPDGFDTDKFMRDMSGNISQAMKDLLNRQAEAYRAGMEITSTFAHQDTPSIVTGVPSLQDDLTDEEVEVILQNCGQRNIPAAFTEDGVENDDGIEIILNIDDYSEGIISAVSQALRDSLTSALEEAKAEAREKRRARKGS